MDHAAYEKLTETCDKVMRSGSRTRVSIPWLHVLSEHPNNLRHYQRLLTHGTREAPDRIPEALADDGGALRHGPVLVQRTILGSGARA